MIVKLKGKVSKWRDKWRALWFPTARISLDNHKLKDWAYKVNVILEWKIYPWVWFVTQRENSFETHIINFNENIYDNIIEIIVIEKIRDFIPKDDIKKIQHLIREDIKYVKKNKTYVLTFGTFESINDWHKYFLTEAKKYWDILVTVLATDKSIEKFKNIKPLTNIEERKKGIKSLGISDVIAKWDENNPLKWIDLYFPCIICLWFDQKWYTKELEEYSKKHPVKIVRLDPYKK